MIPTKKQIQWFWEQCGWRVVPSGGIASPKQLASGEPFIAGNLPPIDLNNLFKYAVPKLYDDMVYGRLQGGEFDESDYIDLIVGWAESVARDKQDPALALFWAIYKALGGKE